MEKSDQQHVGTPTQGVLMGKEWGKIWESRESSEDQRELVQGKTQWI
jgi:hypothetical protein